MPKAFKFSDKSISNLKGTDKKRYVRDVRQGFALRIMPSGAKTFLYIYTDKGTRKELNLGTYPEVTLATALEKYQEAHIKFNNGIDPKYKEPAAELTTFKHFSDLYLEWSEKNHVLALYKINKYSLDNDVLPFWKDRPLAGIGKRDAIELLERVAARSPGQVNNVLRAARGVFKYAVDRDYKEYNPMYGLAKIVTAAKYVPAERYLSDAELKAVWPLLPAHVKLVLVTAQRPGEVAGMHMKEIHKGVDKAQCLECLAPCYTWDIPKERYKSGKAHSVYLTATALDLIGHADTYVFPSPKPDMPIQCAALSRYVNRNKYFGLDEWHPHDLRRTARTIMSRIGIPDEHAEAVLGHAKKGLLKTYNRHDYQEEKAAALIKWEAELLRIVS
jgi:integrase